MYYPKKTKSEIFHATGHGESSIRSEEYPTGMRVTKVWPPKE